MSFAKITVRFAANLKQFSSQMQNANRQLQGYGKNMQRVGQNLTLGLTAPLVALGYKSAVAFDKQAKALAQVEAGVKSTGKAAGFASQELLKMAGDLQNKTIFGDEEILMGATAQLLTFTNIAGEQFARTQEAALDLATRLDGDLKSASIQLGKALNDPVANLSALSRSGIQFSKEQKATINSLVETNRLADAQTIILDELQKQYGGAAEAAANAGLGSFTQLSNIMGDLLEDFGAIIVDGLQPVISFLKRAALAFKELSPGVKKVIVVVGALAAAIGPLLATAGFLMTTVVPGLITLLPTLGAAFTALTGPIGLVVAAIAGIAFIVYKNWDKIKAAVTDLANYFIDLYNESMAVRIAVQYVILVFKNLWEAVKLVVNSIITVFSGMASYIFNSFKNVGAGIKAVLTGNFKEIPKILKAQGKLAADSLKNTFLDLGDDFKQFTTGVKDNLTSAVDAVTRKKITFVESNVDATGIKTAVEKAVIAGTDAPGSGPATGSGPGTRAKVESVDAGVQSGPVDFTQMVELMPKYAESLSANYVKMLANAQEFNEGLTGIIQNTAIDFASGFAEMIGAAAAGSGSLAGLGKFILSTFADMAINIGKMAIGIGFAVEGIKKALQSLAGPVAIAAGVALVALGSFAKNALANTKPKVALADGGLVFGPTTALIGEYAGARSNPEVVAPLDKLKSMLGTPGQNIQVEVTGRLRGRDLQLQGKRASEYLNRLG